MTAPDAATVDQIMALAEDYALEEWHAGEEGRAPRSVEASQVYRATLRAAVERLHLTAVNANRAYNAANERAERAEAERDGRRPMSSVEGMVQRARAERAEAAYEELGASVMNLSHPNCQLLLNDKRRAEAERDALKAELQTCRNKLKESGRYKLREKLIEAYKELDALKELLQEARNHAVDNGHDDYCEFLADNPRSCNCGLVELLARIDAALTQRPPSAALPSDDPHSLS